MSEDTQTPEQVNADREQDIPADQHKPVKAVAPEREPATVKVIALNVDEEFTEPKGWVLREVHSVDVEGGKFFGVLVKLPKPTVRVSEPVNLKD